MGILDILLIIGGIIVAIAVLILGLYAYIVYSYTGSVFSSFGRAISPRKMTNEQATRKRQEVLRDIDNQFANYKTIS